MAKLDDLLEALRREEDGTKVTSVRRPRSLDAALHAAVAMGWAPSANEGANRAVRDDLEAFALGAALDAHVSEHPELTPDLAGVAVAVAELRHDPLADSPDLVRAAAADIVKVKSDATPDDVLIWALSLQTHGIGAKRTRPRRPLVQA
ncbi:MAG: hypothetical protein QOE84_437 [Actinomycetota bacterium]|nr:hypothetical protein [Actinomycetota bacterium]